MSLEQQLFVMEVKDSSYKYKGAYRAFTSSVETFDVRGSLVNVTQYYSVYGPVLGDISHDATPTISFWWNGLSLNDTAPEAAIEQGKNRTTKREKEKRSYLPVGLQDTRLLMQSG
jgi:acyl-homoserine lactone acylase PvdQ